MFQIFTCRALPFAASSLDSRWRFSHFRGERLCHFQKGLGFALERRVQHLLDPPNLTPWSDAVLVSNPGLGKVSGTGMSPSGMAGAAQPFTGAAQISAPDLQGDQDAFGIPESATFLRALLAAVRQRIEPTAIVIDRMSTLLCVTVRWIL